MTIYVVDSSALVKRYVQETGLSWVLGLFDPTFNHEIFIAAITAVEIMAAILGDRAGEVSSPLMQKKSVINLNNSPDIFPCER